MPVQITEIPNLQPTRLNQASPSPHAAAAPAAALGDLAEGIGAISGAFAERAHELQATINAGHLSTARNELDAAREAHFQALDTIHDPQERRRRTDDFLQQSRGIVDQPDFSPVVREKLVPYFDGWASDTRLRSAAEAAQLEQRRASQAMENELRMGFENNDRARVELTLEDNPHLTPEQKTGILQDFDIKQSDYEVEREIYSAPQDWLDENEADSGDDPIKHHQRSQLARRLVREETAEASANMLDGIISGRITSDQQIDNLAADLRPAAREQLKAALAKRNTDAFEVERHSAAYQETTLGEVHRRLDALQPTIGTWDADYIAVDSLIRTLPNSAAKDEAERLLRMKRDNAEEDLSTADGIIRQQFRDARRNGFFSEGTKEVPLKDLIDDGLLTDTDKLRASGMSAEQASIVAEADEAERINVFREQWKLRGGWDSLDPFTRQAFLAVNSGKQGYVEVVDPSASDSRYGAASIELEQYLREHPDAPLEQKQEALFNIIGRENVSSFLDSAIGSPPELELPEGVVPGSLLPPKPDQ